MINNNKVKALAKILQVENIEKTDINLKLTDEQREKKKNLLFEFRDLFIEKIMKINYIHIIDHEIILKLRLINENTDILSR